MLKPWAFSGEDPRRGVAAVPGAAAILLSLAGGEERGRGGRGHGSARRVCFGGGGGAGRLAQVLGSAY